MDYSKRFRNPHSRSFKYIVEDILSSSCSECSLSSTHLYESSEEENTAAMSNTFEAVLNDTKNFEMILKWLKNFIENGYEDEVFDSLEAEDNEDSINNRYDYGNYWSGNDEDYYYCGYDDWEQHTYDAMNNEQYCDSWYECYLHYLFVLCVWSL